MIRTATLALLLIGCAARPRPAPPPIENVSEPEPPKKPAGPPPVEPVEPALTDEQLVELIKMVIWEDETSPEPGLERADQP